MQWRGLHIYFVNEDVIFYGFWFTETHKLILGLYQDNGIAMVNIKQFFLDLI